LALNRYVEAEQLNIGVLALNSVKERGSHGALRSQLPVAP
jgi:hypothetical protein